MEENNSIENETNTGRLHLEIDVKNMPWIKEQIDTSKEDFYELILFNNVFSVSLKHKFRQGYIHQVSPNPSSSDFCSDINPKDSFYIVKTDFHLAFNSSAIGSFNNYVDKMRGMGV